MRSIPPNSLLLRSWVWERTARKRADRHHAQDRKLLQSVTGRGITKNMADCYESLSITTREGDRIYLIGFSLVPTLSAALPTRSCYVAFRQGGERPAAALSQTGSHMLGRPLKPFMSMALDIARKDYETERDNRPEDFAQSTVQICR